jgi:hypothetical protein
MIPQILAFISREDVHLHDRALLAALGAELSIGEQRANFLYHSGCFIELMNHNTFAALLAFEQALVIYGQLNDEYGVAMVSYRIGVMYSALGRKEGEQYLNVATELATRNGYDDLLMDVWKSMGEYRAQWLVYDSAWQARRI